MPFFRDLESPVHFARWVLSDLSKRAPMGKRQIQPMIGCWMVRPTTQHRVNDLPERRYVALRALMESGMTKRDALKEVYRLLDINNEREKAAIRVGYSDYEVRFGASLLPIWIGYYRQWVDWALSLENRDKELLLKAYSQPLANQINALISEVQNVARANGVESLYRDEEWYSAREGEIRKEIALCEMNQANCAEILSRLYVTLAIVLHEEGKYLDARAEYTCSLKRYRQRTSIAVSATMIPWIEEQIKRCDEESPHDDPPILGHVAESGGDFPGT